MVTLFHPLALWALAAVPLLLAIYLLRSRFQPRPVSSLLLWRDATRPHAGGRRLRRLRTPFLFFLELLAILALVAAAVDPRRPLLRRGGDLLLVLDDSASMNAGPPGAAPRDLASAALRREIDRGRFRQVQPILAALQPRLLPLLTVPPAGGLPTARLAAWRCRAPGADLDSAIALALELARRGGRVLVVTDHPPPEAFSADGRLRWLAFGQPYPNLGFVNAGRDAGQPRDRGFVEVANFDARPARVDLQAVEGALPAALRALELAPGETRLLRFDLPAGGAPLQLALPSDALSADNHVLLLHPAERLVRVRLEIGDVLLARLFDDALNASGLRAALSAAPHLLITDGSPPPTAARDCWRLALRHPAEARPFAGPFIVDTTHPLAEGLALEQVLWGATTNAPAPGRPVILAGHVPLLTDEEQLDGGHLLHLQFTPAQSTLTRTPNWPAFVWNLLAWRATRLPGIAQPNLRVGLPAALTIAPATTGVRHLAPDGEEETLIPRRDLVLATFDAPGLHHLRDGDSDHLVAANFLAADESDLRRAVRGDWGDWQAPDMLRRETLATAWCAALAALLLLVGHQAVVAGRRGEAVR